MTDLSNPRVVLSRISDITSSRMKTKQGMLLAIDQIGEMASGAVAAMASVEWAKPAPDEVRREQVAFLLSMVQETLVHASGLAMRAGKATHGTPAALIFTALRADIDALCARSPALESLRAIAYPPEADPTPRSGTR
jgi:hypothetical protein